MGGSETQAGRDRPPLMYPTEPRKIPCRSSSSPLCAAAATAVVASALFATNAAAGTLDLSKPADAHQAMLRLVGDLDGKPVTTGQAALRYVLAWPSVCFLGVGLIWALLDRDRQFLHDRLAGTRLIGQ